MSKLREYREELFWSRTELAKRTGLKARTIACWERGESPIAKASFDSIMKLSTVLGVKPEDLYEEEGASDGK